MAIVETHMVTTAQVFLPYAVKKDGQTVYEYIASHIQRVCRVVCVHTFPRTGFASLSSRQVRALY